jgi:hypothetical protein
MKKRRIANSSRLSRCLIAFCLSTATAGAGVPEVQHLPAVYAQDRGGLPTTLSASGPIAVIHRQQARVFLLPTKPFWAPPPSGTNRIVRWPPDTLFVVSVSATVPITIDGKKAGFAQLAVGQNLDVQYVLTEGFYGGVSCAATRMDVPSPSAPKTEKDNRKSSGRH